LVGWLASWLAGWAVLALVGWLACWFVGWDHLQASKFKEAQEIQQVDELHQAIKGQKINDAVAALEAKWDAVDSACTIPKAKKSLKKQISNDSEGYPVLRSEATQLTKHSQAYSKRWLAGWLVGWLAGQYSPWLVGWLVGLLAGITCRPGWLVGWLAGQYSPWLVGWLVGLLAGITCRPARPFG
jgi:hypothetical protein